LDMRTIKSRKAKYTYGLAIMTNFVKGRHRDDKKEFIGDQVRCKDIFSVHVEKGQTLESEEAQSEKCLVRSLFLCLKGDLLIQVN
jgi:hypothetical protein